MYILHFLSKEPTIFLSVYEMTTISARQR